MATSQESAEGVAVASNSGQSMQAQPVRSTVMGDPNDINIVLIGEIGVGKSTFINAFVNYLNFNSLQEATDSSKIICLIASKFTVSDENSEECRADGTSSTRSTRSYRFSMGDRYVRLIDTPGIGDIEGVDEDEENFDRVLNALAELKFIHAFCILSKPNNNKPTVIFEYCIKQLLSRLNKSASRNIVFLFTNSRRTCYKPGDDSRVPTRLILEQMKEITKVDIPFDKENVFCMDNEAFRFLLATRKGINFTQSETNEFAASWGKSVQASCAMLDYIAHLTPYKIQDSISINEARRLIINLSDPLARVAKNIDDNIRLIDRKRAQLTDKDKDIEELRQHLHFGKMRMEVIEIDRPNTVCTHIDCTDVYVIYGFKHIHYKQVCHTCCYCLGKEAKQVIGSPELKRCLAMDDDPVKPTCKHCGHSYAIHMRIYFDTKPREISEKIQANIKKEEEVKKGIADMIEELSKKTASLEKEKEAVQKSMAKFAHFLSDNAITPYNDTYEEYIRYLIDKELSWGTSTDENLLTSYDELMDVHEEQRRILDEQLKKAGEMDNTAKVITADDVMNLIEELHQLEFSGNTIREFYEKQQKARQHETLFLTEKNVDGGLWYDPIKKMFQWRKKSEKPAELMKSYTAQQFSTK